MNKENQSLKRLHRIAAISMAALIGSLALVQIGIHRGRALTRAELASTQPYALVVENMEDAKTWALCRADDNCMDIMSVDDILNASKSDDLSEYGLEGGCGSDLDCCTQYGDCDEDFMADVREGQQL